MTAAPKNSVPDAVETPRLDGAVTPFFRIPDRAHFRYFLKLALIVGIWFKLLFNGTDYIASLHPHRVDVAMQWELSAIPFVPQFTLIYSSIYLSMLLLPFVLRTRRELRAMGMALMTTIGVAAIAFLLFPTEPAYAPLPSHYPLDWLHEVTRRLALRHNLAPSLHVAMSWLILRTLATKASTAVAVSLIGWAWAIALATLLTHQHHVIDVMSGALLAELIYRVVYLKRARNAPDPVEAEPGVNASA